MKRICGGLLAAVLLAAPVFPQDPASGDARQRRRAARDLARQGPEAIPRLAAMLKDPDLEVRIEAVKSLVEIDTPRSLDPLIEALQDNDPEIQIRATDGLVNFYLPGYVRTGLTASLRRTGSRLMSRFTDTNDQVIDPYVEVRPEVIQALGKLVRGGSSMESRANAARAIGILRGQAAVPDLLEGVRSKDSQLMYECLIALQKIRDQSAGPKVGFLVRDLDKKVQIAAIETAGLLYNREALPDLREVLRSTRDRDVRRAALTALAMLPDPENAPLLRQYLSDRDAGLRGAAAEGLGRLKDRSDLPALEKAFEDERDASARLSLAFALVLHGQLSTSELAPLRYLIDNLNSARRSGQAQPLLIELARDAQVRQALHPAVRTGTKDEKIGLAWVLARSGGPEDVEVLEALTRDADLTVASEALRAVRTLKARIE
ncbi:MAG: HEAT repeat domain-containing protein [Bryobacteraceae bacterium]|nr:HEAT repeat domain-containing protein [Bryobacteraceae bacterium]